MIQKHHQSNLDLPSSVEMDRIFLEDEIEDSQLRMIFTCCQSFLPKEAQIALTLKTLCGFGIKEVARAMLTSESTINKRLYRAKEKIRSTDPSFSIPQGKELDTKIESVLLTLYLLFNEGYNSTAGNSVIQKELCLEAIRLTKLLADHFEDQYQAHALLSLMCFHTARFEARLDNRGTIVLFEDQDRSLWNKDLIHIGMKRLQKSIQGNILTAYHIEARIAAEHCNSDNFNTTNWELIYEQYQLLEKLKPNPVIKLNLAIIKSKIHGIEASLPKLEMLSNSPELKAYHLLPATQGIFHMKLNDYEQAITYLKKSLLLKPSPAERDFIEKKVAECERILGSA